MNERPRSITVISGTFIVFGCIGFAAGFLPFVQAAASGRVTELGSQEFYDLGLVSIVRILAVIAGVFMLYGFNWARWLLVAWLGYHVALSILHSPLQLIFHSVLSAIVIYFLFRPSASAYFRASAISRDGSRTLVHGA